MHKKFALMAAGVAFVSANTFAVSHGEIIGSTCFSCHGPNGKSRSTIPSLAGLDKHQFVKTMQDFKSGARPASVMRKHAAGYTDAEYAQMGEFFSKLE